MKPKFPLLLIVLALSACAGLKVPFSAKPAPAASPQAAADGTALTLAKVQAALAALQGNADLAGLAPTARDEAAAAVADAAKFEHDPGSGAQRLYVADRKVATAEALAQAEYYRAQLKALPAP